MEKTNPVLILTKCVLHMCGARFSSRHFLKGWLAAFQASGPPVVPFPTHGSAQLGVVFACAHCYKLCLVGWTWVFALSALPSTPGWSCTPPCWRWGCRGLPTSSINPLVSAPSRARPWALLYTYPRLLSSSFCNWEWRPSSWGKENLGGGAQPCLPSSFLHPGCCFGPAAAPSPLLSGSLPCSPPAHAFYYQETCTHFNPRAGAGGARMDK